MKEDVPIITKDQMAALLGRPLSSVEDKNYELYLNVTALRLDDLLCTDIANMQNIPADLQLLIARCFATVLQEQETAANHGVNRKQVEDFSISYFEDATSPMVEFVRLNAATIDKYGQCQAPMRSGEVCRGDCFRCI